MSRKWWFKTIVIIFLLFLSVILLMPTYVEMIAYPEIITEESSKEEADDTSADNNAQNQPAAEAPSIQAADDQNKTADDKQDAEPPRNPPLPSWYTALPKWMTSKTLALGLDLRGGLMLRYTVDIDSALDEKLSRYAADMKRVLADQGVSLKDYRIDHDQRLINLYFHNKDDMAAIDKKFMENFQNLLTDGTDDNQFIVTIALRDSFIDDTRQSAVTAAVDIVRDRIDELGVASPSVRVEAGEHIIVELPGISRKRAASAEKLLSTTAVLTFKLCADEDAEELPFFTALYEKVNDPRIKPFLKSLSASDYRDEKGNYKSGKELLKKLAKENASMIPTGREIAFEKISLRELQQFAEDDEDLSKQPPVWRMRLVRTDIPVLTGDNVDNAYPVSNPNTGMPEVSLKLDKRGGDTFYEITKQHKKEKLAILMDDVLVSDPVIRTEIPGGNVSIRMGTGNRNEILDEVNNLVVSLRSGALPAPIRLDYKTLVGPSLGHDSIEKGSISLIIGFILVFLTMLFYYRGGGLAACIALTLNLIFILAGMAGMGAALTMPGIAGIVLTVGMAVDSNVIIFERIREEMRAGETSRKATQIGYEKALWTILDSNITTAIAAIILMEFGSGPVKGFAVTLLLGIICSVYTAFNVTRTMLEAYTHSEGRKIHL